MSFLDKIHHAVDNLPGIVDKGLEHARAEAIGLFGSKIVLQTN
jgi:hypothetical protein